MGEGRVEVLERIARRATGLAGAARVGLADALDSKKRHYRNADSLSAVHRGAIETSPAFEAVPRLASDCGLATRKRHARSLPSLRFLISLLGNRYIAQGYRDVKGWLNRMLITLRSPFSGQSERAGKGDSRPFDGRPLQVSRTRWRPAGRRRYRGNTASREDPLRDNHRPGPRGQGRFRMLQPGGPAYMPPDRTLNWQRR